MRWYRGLCTDLLTFTLQGNLGKTSARRPSMKAVRSVVGVPYLQMRSVGSHSTSGMEKEGKKERTRWCHPLCQIHSQLVLRVPRTENVPRSIAYTKSMAYKTRRFNAAFTIRILIWIWINPIPRIDTYFFKIHSSIVLPSRPSWRSLSCRFAC